MEEVENLLRPFAPWFIRSGVSLGRPLVPRPAPPTVETSSVVQVFSDRSGGVDGVHRRDPLQKFRLTPTVTARLISEPKLTCAVLPTLAETA